MYILYTIYFPDSVIDWGMILLNVCTSEKFIFISILTVWKPVYCLLYLLLWVKLTLSAVSLAMGQIDAVCCISYYGSNWRCLLYLFVRVKLTLSAVSLTMGQIDAVCLLFRWVKLTLSAVSLTMGQIGAACCNSYCGLKFKTILRYEILDQVNVLSHLRVKSVIWHA